MDSPDGFATNVTLVGEEYVPPSAGGPGPAGERPITLGVGNLASSIVRIVSVNAAGNVVVFGTVDGNLRLKLQPTTGQFSGSFTGLTLQSDGSGWGCFLGTNESGYVVLELVP